jgi:hypothetical protein
MKQPYFPPSDGDPKRRVAAPSTAESTRTNGNLSPIERSKSTDLRGARLTVRERRPDAVKASISRIVPARIADAQ